MQIAAGRASSPCWRCVGYIAVVHPVELSTRGGVARSPSPRPACIVLYFLLLLALSSAARASSSALIYERPLRGFRARARRARGADRRRRRRRPPASLREILRNPELGYRPVGFVDDDPRKRGLRDRARAQGARHHRRASPRVLDEVEPDEVMIAIPSAPGTLRARVVSACRERGDPGAHAADRVRAAADRRAAVMRQVREVRVEDVLGREPVRMELERVGAYLRRPGRAGHRRGRLDRRRAVPPDRARRRRGGWCCVDHAEDNLFEIQRELEEERHVRTRRRRCWPTARRRSACARCSPSTGPTVVFHAAAYKHVALMEANPVEAVRNNALATRLVARVAGEAGVERVRARLHRQGGHARDRDGRLQGARRVGRRGRRGHATPGTRYATVRFGNVLGSSGSVVPIFRRQIAAGGPVTVTDPRMTRYFMTIPEAVQLDHPRRARWRTRRRGVRAGDGRAGRDHRAGRAR